MSAAARRVAADIAKQRDAFGGSAEQALALRAAVAGLPSSFDATISAIGRMGAASAAAKQETVALFGQSQNAAQSYSTALAALNAKTIGDIRALNAEYEKQRGAVKARAEVEGVVSPASQAELRALTTGREQVIKALLEERAVKAASLAQQGQIAAAAEATATKQVAAAQRVIDAQKGVKAGYREELELLRQLRDAGNLTPAQFKTAASSLALQQPAAKALAEQRALAAQTVVEQKTIANAQVAAAQRIVDANNGVSASYRKQLDEILALRRAGVLNKDDARTAVTGLNAQQPDGRAKQAFLANLNTLAAGINDDGTQKARSALLALQAAQLGVGKEAEAALKKLTALDEKTGQFGKSAFGARNRLLTLQYTISDVIASAGSGISPLTILLQQGGQVFDAFGGANAQGKGGFFRNFFGTLAQIITPARLAITATAGAVALLGTAMFKGASQSKAFADAMVLSGNFAGQTESQFTALTRSVAASGLVNVATAREFGQALIATGEVGPKVFAAATEAAARYGQATGKNAKEVADDFAAMGRDVTKWATEHNSRLNFVTAAQLQHIRTLQDQGRAVEAQGEVYALLNRRLAELEPNLGLLDKALLTVSGNWARFWDAAFDVGRTANPVDRIASLRQQLELSANNPNYTREQIFSRGGLITPALSDEARSTLSRELRAREQAQASAAVLASNTAEMAKLNKEAADVGPFIKGMQDRANTAKSLTRELEAANVAFAKQDALAAKDPAFQATPVAERTAIFKDIIERNTKKGPREKKDNEPDQIRREQLAADLKFLQDKLAEERETLAFNNREVAALYQAGKVSLKDFTSAKVREIEEGTQRQLNALIDEQARLEVALEDPLVKANESERVKLQGQLDEAINKSAQVATAGARAVRLANIDEEQSFVQLADQVANYRAELLQLAGDEAGAARIRTAQAIKAAQDLARRSQGTPGAISAQEQASQAAALRNQDALNQARRETDLITQGLALTEERIALLQKQGSISEVEALERQGQARRKVVAGLEAQLAVMQRAYDEAATKNPELLLGIERTRLELDKLKDSLDPLKEKFDNLFKDAGSSFFSDLAGGKGLKAALGSFGNIISQNLSSFVGKQAAEQVFGPKGILGGAGGFLADVFGGGAKGGGEGAAQAAATAAITTAQATSAATIVAANAAAEAATATAIVTAMGASTTAIVAAIGASALGGAGAGALGSLGGFGTGAGFGNLDLGLFLHQGGIAGLDGKATRYHSGGVAGLAPDEVPAILRRGEEVLTRRDPRHRANSGQPDRGGGAVFIDLRGLTVDSRGSMDRMAEDRSAQRIARKAERYLSRKGA